MDTKRGDEVDIQNGTKEAKDIWNTWRNRQARSSGRFGMNGISRVERPVRSKMDDMKLSFRRLLVRYFVNMWLVRMLPMRNPEKPRVHTRLMVDVSVAKL